MIGPRRYAVALTLLTGAGGALLSACRFDRVLGSGTKTSGQPYTQGTSPGDPTFLQPAPGAPSIANPVISYWVKKGTDKVVRMYYHAEPGQSDSTTFLLLHFSPNSLGTRPDGSTIADGDSVLVTSTLIDPSRLLVDCQPAGLRFTTSDPVTMTMSYAYTNVALTGAGQKNLQIWLREVQSDPWHALPSTINYSTVEVESTIGGFTGYAVAY